MLNVDYKKPYGYYTLTQGENKFKIVMCKANCMFAEMYFYKNEEGTEMAQLQGFFLDMPHFNRVNKHSEAFAQSDNYVFYAKELNNDLWKVIRRLAENGKKVTIK